MSSTVRTPPPTVSGMKQASAVRVTTSKMVSRFSWLAVMSRKQQLVGAGRVIGDRRLDRIAGVAQIDEVDALDDAAVLDVEAGDDADLEHGGHACPRGADHAQAPRRRIEPPVIERAAGDRAFELLRARLEHRLHVVDRGEAARAITGIEIASASAIVASQLMPLQHAVARDVGVDDRGDAGVLEAPRDVERGQLRRLGPALDRDLAVARIEADRDRAWDISSPLPSPAPDRAPPRCR